MQFLKTLFWVVGAIILVVFTLNNWQPVTVKLWEGLLVDTKLPILVVGAFLLGFLPTWLMLRTVSWRLNRRITSLEASHYRVSESPRKASEPGTEPPAPEAPPAVTAE